MKLSSKLLAATVALAMGAAALWYAARLDANEVAPISELSKRTHIHGLAVDQRDPSRLLIATHHGLFRTRPGDKAERVSVVQDFMGFNVHPRDPDTLYASGHPAGGGNLGFIASRDGGRTWTEISPGMNGPVDFHQMTVSRADPSVIYGAYRSLQISRDGGKTWRLAGSAPENLIDLAASAKHADTLYAAAEGGLFVSTDAGESWKAVINGAPVSLVEVAPDGTLYAFVLGRGLVKSGEPAEAFEGVSNSFGAGYLLHLASDPTNPDRLFAATGDGQILASTDRGKTWTPIGRSGS